MLFFVGPKGDSQLMDSFRIPKIIKNKLITLITFLSSANAGFEAAHHASQESVKVVEPKVSRPSSCESTCWPVAFRFHWFGLVRKSPTLPWWGTHGYHPKMSQWHQRISIEFHQKTLGLNLRVNHQRPSTRVVQNQGIVDGHLATRSEGTVRRGPKIMARSSTNWRYHDV